MLMCSSKRNSIISPSGQVSGFSLVAMSVISTYCSLSIHLFIDRRAQLQSLLQHQNTYARRCKHGKRHETYQMEVT
ncbi:hypothetical protein P152DRAFT_99115 [Eremomyces bilateralis CBS 781.70]|uniref:Uncharacterized protein n=1 Tax=Eremomyces bilateralis CBS 781.70 TaxID=1392243 RepID=A0A6G1FXE7_9PEZI|nr:uncharacterized protein P152DRAFT_99115 [Eremomyces bilateralis CBS 781.70]KAF1810454.1 hypothetical protein P152DRAFT_99115 [Eremomyces bilateralis CBS 781.70]